MVLVSADQITKTYGDRTIFQRISLHIDSADKIGVIGINGTGKSTLLRIIAQDETPEEGSLTYARDLKTSYLEQNPTFQHSLTIEEQVRELTSGEDSNLEYEVHKVLNQLGLSDFSLEVDSLSGGEKKKIAMAVALLRPSDLLLLDEPTNHLDMEAVLWLETFLRQYKGAIVMITHDRYFLDRVTNKIVEIRQGNLYSYQCNFAEYLEIKAQEEESLVATERKNKSLFRRELEWMQQGAKARGTKSKERIQRFEALQDREAPTEATKLDLSGTSSRLGKQIIEIENISKSYDDTLIISDFSYHILRDDRIGIIGKNGSGKTTLFKIIYGELLPDTGEVKKGSTVKIGYFSQEEDDLHTKQNLRVIDYVKENADYITTPSGTITATQMLERFLFPSDIQYTTISRLSGGEQKRLFLLKLLMESPNVLLLDEPTNDLDIVTLQVLEEYLEDFQGAVLTISHDRYFLDKVVNSIFAFEEQGKIAPYTGNYSDYTKKSRKTSQDTQEKTKPVSPKQGKPQKSKKVKFTFKEKYDYEHIEEEIKMLEKKIETISTSIEQESANYEKLEPLLEEKATVEMLLLEKLDYWAYLEDLSDQINAEN